MTPRLLIHLVDSAALVLGLVQSRWTPRHMEFRIARSGVHPLIGPALQEAGRLALPDLMKVLDPRRPPIVRYHLERTIPGGRLVHVEIDPYQVDVLVHPDHMQRLVADELAGHATNMLRRFPWEG